MAGLVFKRRDARPWLTILANLVWPRGGWARAAQYVKLRLRRLPGTPEEIARGIFAGTFIVYTPFFGLHFLFSALMALIMRGSVIAALLATFLGNPLTYLPIAAVSLGLGRWMLGLPPLGAEAAFEQFGRASAELWHNFRAIFTPAEAHWDGLIAFWHAVFLPWIVGGILPGLLTGLLCYWLSVPIIRAYQKRRSARLQKKMQKLRKQAGTGAADS